MRTIRAADSVGGTGVPPVQTFDRARRRSHRVIELILNRDCSTMLHSLMHLQTGRDGVVSRRSFLRNVAAGAAGFGAARLEGSSDAARRRDAQAGHGVHPALHARRPQSDSRPSTRSRESTQGGPHQGDRHRRQRHPHRRGVGQRRQADEGHRPDSLDDQQGRRAPAGHLSAPYRLHPRGRHQAPERRLDRRQRDRPKEFDLPNFVSIGGRQAPVGAASSACASRRSCVADPTKMPSNAELPSAPSMPAVTAGASNCWATWKKISPKPAASCAWKATRRSTSNGLANGAEPAPEGVRCCPGKRCDARRLRPNGVRAGLLARPPPGRNRRHFRRSRAERLGHAQRQLRSSQDTGRRGRPRLCRPGRRPERTRDAGQNAGDLDGRVRPYAADQPAHRPRPLSRAPSTSPSPAAASRAARSSAPPAPKAPTSPTAR